MQTHNKFKVFIAAGTDVLERAEAVLNAYRVAPKSLGVEYIEGKDLVVLTVGYRDDETPQPFKLVQVNMGKLELDANVIAVAMEDAAAKVENILCHEFYVNAAGEFFTVFMIQG